MYHARENKIPTSQRNRSWSIVPCLVVLEFTTTIRTRPIIYVDYYERDELVLSVSCCEFLPDKMFVFLTMATYNIDHQVGPRADNAECRTLSASQAEWHTVKQPDIDERSLIFRTAIVAAPACSFSIRCTSWTYNSNLSRQQSWAWCWRFS